jgi:predicted protein tyrosine phosphatase
MAELQSASKREAEPLEIIVTDRRTIEAGIVVRSNYVVISIHDPGEPPANVAIDPGLRGVLALSFFDIDPSPEFELPESANYMAREQAVAIWDFIELYRGHIGTVVVHCKQGMSRSPAVAAALSEALGLDPRRFWRDYNPNPHVYHCLMEAFERRASTKETKP